ncbi:ATP-binding cassette domain-containing protein [Erysipelothrix sp. HDW6C]|uniref:ATP-binding cassette domain-containing protein n=1 Tax=Erysipelothrix sp. HDW6C TaxID=2714930 RepID=UPI00140D7046|nr:ATP-binding cassette domain-containing protein [Erysipelothrix sp. HDW6C]QIK69836.1 ATP-binding cassette domain-containing protein [Erysipelothrix sp. HDW6C]
METKPLFNIQNLQKYFPIKKQSIFQKHQDYVKANKDITLEIFRGETLGIVGESGCGKSTLGRTIIQLQEQTGGTTMFYGETIEGLMPRYVKKAYAALPKISKFYDEDFANLERLKQQDDADAYRLKKIEFDTKYGNVLRLAGGLLVHDDLDLVSDVLSQRYEFGSKLAKLQRDHDFQIDRYMVSMEHLTEAKDKAELIEKEIERVKHEFDDIEAKIQTIKEDLMTHERFAYYESFLDHGIDLASLEAREMRMLRDRLQIIFQDPYSSLNPKLTVGDIIGEGVITHGLFKNKTSEGYVEYIQDIMEKCGLKAEFMNRYPHQFSGGQRQRIGIARAIALKPKFIVCDEAVSALDVSIQSQIINLLQDLKEKEDLTYLFITHDLGVVRYISDRIGVMYFGNLVELAPAEDIFTNPQHPYTKRLLAAIPRLEGDSFEISEQSTGPFEFRFEATGEADKDWYEVSPGHFVACHLHERGIPS